MRATCGLLCAIENPAKISGKSNLMAFNGRVLAETMTLILGLMSIGFFLKYLSISESDASSNWSNGMFFL